MLPLDTLRMVCVVKVPAGVHLLIGGIARLATSALDWLTEVAGGSAMTDDELYAAFKAIDSDNNGVLNRQARMAASTVSRFCDLLLR